MSKSRKTTLEERIEVEEIGSFISHYMYKRYVKRFGGFTSSEYRSLAI